MKGKWGALLAALSMAMMCGSISVCASSCDHYCIDEEYKTIDANYHSYTGKCIYCGEIITTKEAHQWHPADDDYLELMEEPSRYDSKYHYYKVECECGATSEIFKEHDWNSFDIIGDCEYQNDEYHVHKLDCTYCDATQGEKQKHKWEYDTSLDEISYYNNTYHTIEAKCFGCNASKDIKIKHEKWKCLKTSYKKHNKNDHWVIKKYECDLCWEPFTVKSTQDHDWETKKTTKIKGNKKIITTYKKCSTCGEIRSKKETTKALKAKLNYKAFRIEKGYTSQVKLLYTTKTVKWTSNNTKVATVSTKGKIKAVGVGRCTISANYNGKRYSVKVEVIKGEPYFGAAVTGYYTRDNYFSIRIKNKNKLPLTIYASNAVAENFDYKSFDRNLHLPQGKNITIKPGKTKTVYFYAAGDSTWYDYKNYYVYFYILYDNIDYRIRTWSSGSAYYNGKKWIGMGSYK